MKIYYNHTYSGPNIYSTDPVMVFSMETNVEDIESGHDRIVKISEIFRSWFEWGPVPTSFDSFTLADFLVQFIKQALNEVRGRVRFARAQHEARLIMVIGYHDRDTTLIAVKLAASIFSDVFEVSELILKEKIESLWKRCRMLHPDYQAGILIDAAKAADIPVLRVVDRSKFWQYGWGSCARVFMESASTGDSMVGHMICSNKQYSNRLLQSWGIPTPRQEVVTSESGLTSALSSIGFPCVIKPLDSGGGKGVKAGIRSREQMIAAYNLARSIKNGPVIVEEFVEGHDHRLFVVNGECIAVVRREPAFVTGNGKSTIRQLIRELNVGRSRNMVRSRYRRPIPIDEILEEHISIQGWSLDQVLPSDKVVTLRSNANLSTGGASHDVSTAVHKQVFEAVSQLSTSLGLMTMGFDYVTTDISAPPSVSGGKFIEMNTIPGLDGLKETGLAGKDVAAKVLGTDVGRIPVELELVPCTSSVDLESLSLSRHSAAISGSRVRVGDRLYSVEESEPWFAVKGVLTNRMVESLRIFSSSTDIIRHGLPVDRFTAIEMNELSVPDPWIDLLHGHCQSLYSR